MCVNPTNTLNSYVFRISSSLGLYFLKQHRIYIATDNTITREIRCTCIFVLKFCQQ